MRPKTLHSSQKVAGIGVLLILVVACLFLVAWSGSAPTSVAAGLPLDRQDPAPGLAASGAVTYTAFLPYISLPPGEAANMWYAEYYDNMYLNDEPVRTADQVRVDFDWEDEGPAGLPEDFFSIRWTGDWYFDYGIYTFFIDADDGVRLWLDGVQLTKDNVWDAGIHTVRVRRLIDEGPHELKLEYYERTQLAYIRLYWKRTDVYPRWYGEYYRLPWADESGKSYEQMDDDVQFEWGEDCPDGLPCDGFSVVWEAEPVFTPGNHRIYVYADDGYQLYVDNTKNPVQEGGWFDGQAGGGEDDWYNLEFSQVEEHRIIYKFQDRGGLAEARIWLQDMEQPYWTAEYYNNRSLAGDPVKVDDDPVIFHDWKWDNPKRGVHGDDFSIRWTGERYFFAGCYRFAIFADDGARLRVDGELLIDDWKDGRTENYAPVTYLSSGDHEIIIEYYEHDNEAEIRFWW